MIYREKPCFIIKKNLQKSGTTGVYFSDSVTKQVLKILLKITFLLAIKKQLYFCMQISLIIDNLGLVFIFLCFGGSINKRILMI